MKKSGLRDELLQVCRDFIRENGISCSEVIYQSDRIILNSQDFIKRICDVVGYHDVEEEEK